MDPKWKVLLQSVFLVLQKNEPITNNEFQTYEKIIPQECSNDIMPFLQATEATTAWHSRTFGLQILMMAIILT